MLTRRGLFGILAGAVAAPIVVRSGLLMPVKALVMPEQEWAFRMKGVDFPADEICESTLYVRGLPAMHVGDTIHMHGSEFRITNVWRAA